MWCEVSFFGKISCLTLSVSEASILSVVMRDKPSCTDCSDAFVIMQLDSVTFAEMEGKSYVLRASGNNQNPEQR